MTTLYIDKRSGNCTKVTMLVDYLGLEVEIVDVDLFNNETRSDEFLARNPFGKVPTAILPCGKTIGESNAIMLALAGGTSLVPLEEGPCSELYQWLFWEASAFTPPLGARRFFRRFAELSDAEIDATLMPRGQRVLRHLNDHLANNEFVAADTLTIADFSLYGYGHSAHEGGFDLDAYPHIIRWLARIEALAADKAA